MRARVLTFSCMLGLATSCGFAPETNFTGRRIGDGIAPWEDLGAIDICLANRRVGPESSSTGGFCFDRNSPNENPCSEDSDCLSRERCTCGRCTVKFCSTSGECGPGWTCASSTGGDRGSRCARRCIVDDDCPARYEICVGGACRGRCRDDKDCQAGEVCSSKGRCVVAACDQDEDCTESEICKVQRQPRSTAQPAPLARGASDPVSAPLVTMYFEMTNEVGTRRGIWRAISRDGRAFVIDPAKPVMEHGNIALAPSVVRTGTGYRLYFESSEGIFTAESKDGVSFGEPELLLRGEYHSPAAAVTDDGKALVFLERGEREGISLFSGDGNPTSVLLPRDVTDRVLWREVERVGSPHVLIESTPTGESTIRLWFDAFGQESAVSKQFGKEVPIPPNDSIGFASAPVAKPSPMVLWPFNPVLDRVEAFLDHRGERAPAVVALPDGEEYLLYFQATAADGSDPEGIRVAKNPPAL
ncbi:MAG: hypothetical protein HY698_03920 [Deltaproteobacteria bacterium]|nr:hypothetical protein [Deltaproteobacteria bacterium]